MIFDFLFGKNECRHEHLPFDANEAYCPDCGELVVTKWYLVRCACCNIKRKGKTCYGKVIPETKYCPNCGASAFYVTELEKVNFVDVRYAVIKREIKKQGTRIINEVWVEEREDEESVKLLSVKPHNL